MLLHMTHVHTWENCPAHDPERLARFKKALGEVEGKGLRLLSAHVNAPAHTFYLLIDADSMEALTRWWEPFLEWGQGEISPVTDLKATSEMMESLQQKK